MNRFFADDRLLSEIIECRDEIEFRNYLQSHGISFDDIDICDFQGVDNISRFPESNFVTMLELDRVVGGTGPKGPKKEHEVHENSGAQTPGNSVNSSKHDSVSTNLIGDSSLSGKMTGSFDDNVVVQDGQELPRDEKYPNAEVSAQGGLNHSGAEIKKTPQVLPSVKHLSKEEPKHNDVGADAPPPVPPRNRRPSVGVPVQGGSNHSGVETEKRPQVLPRVEHLSKKELNHNDVGADVQNHNGERTKEPPQVPPRNRRPSVGVTVQGGSNHSGAEIKKTPQVLPRVEHLSKKEPQVPHSDGRPSVGVPAPSNHNSGTSQGVAQTDGSRWQRFKNVAKGKVIPVIDGAKGKVIPAIGGALDKVGRTFRNLVSQSTQTGELKNDSNFSLSNSNGAGVRTEVPVRPASQTTSNLDDIYTTKKTGESIPPEGQYKKVDGNGKTVNQKRRNHHIAVIEDPEKEESEEKREREISVTAFLEALGKGEIDYKKIDDFNSFTDLQIRQITNISGKNVLSLIDKFGLQKIESNIFLKNLVITKARGSAECFLPELVSEVTLHDAYYALLCAHMVTPLDLMRKINSAYNSIAVGEIEGKISVYQGKSIIIRLKEFVQKVENERCNYKELSELIQEYPKLEKWLLPGIGDENLSCLFPELEFFFEATKNCLPFLLDEEKKEKPAVLNSEETKKIYDCFFRRTGEDSFTDKGRFTDKVSTSEKVIELKKFLTSQLVKDLNSDIEENNYTINMDGLSEVLYDFSWIIPQTCNPEDYSKLKDNIKNKFLCFALEHVIIYNELEYAFTPCLNKDLPVCKFFKLIYGKRFEEEFPNLSKYVTEREKELNRINEFFRDSDITGIMEKYSDTVRWRVCITTQGVDADDFGEVERLYNDRDVIKKFRELNTTTYIESIENEKNLKNAIAKRLGYKDAESVSEGDKEKFSEIEKSCEKVALFNVILRKCMKPVRDIILSQRNESILNAARAILVNRVLEENDNNTDKASALGIFDFICDMDKILLGGKKKKRIEFELERLLEYTLEGDIKSGESAYDIGEKIGRMMFNFRGKEYLFDSINRLIDEKVRNGKIKLLAFVIGIDEFTSKLYARHNSGDARVKGEILSLFIREAGYCCEFFKDETNLNDEAFCRRLGAIFERFGKLTGKYAYKAQSLILSGKKDEAIKQLKEKKDDWIGGSSDIKLWLFDWDKKLENFYTMKSNVDSKIEKLQSVKNDELDNSVEELAAEIEKFEADYVKKDDDSFICPIIKTMANEEFSTWEKGNYLSLCEAYSFRKEVNKAKKSLDETYEKFVENKESVNEKEVEEFFECEKRFNEFDCNHCSGENFVEKCTNTFVDDRKKSVEQFTAECKNGKGYEMRYEVNQTFRTQEIEAVRSKLTEAITSITFWRLFVYFITFQWGFWLNQRSQKRMLIGLCQQLNDKNLGFEDFRKIRSQHYDV